MASAEIGKELERRIVRLEEIKSVIEKYKDE